MRLNPIQPRYVGKLDLASAGGVTQKLPLPRDRFISAILASVTLGELSGGATGEWNTDAGDAILKNIRCVIEGSDIKNAPYFAFKEIAKMNEQYELATGKHKLYFKDKLIPLAGELPAWDFTSFELEFDVDAIANLQTGDRDAWADTFVDITVLERPYAGEDLANWKILREKIPTYKKYANNITGEVTYEHMRVHTVYQYLYIVDDDEVLSDDVFDILSLIGQTREREHKHIDKMRVSDIQMENDSRFRQGISEGFLVLEFPEGLDESFYTTLMTYLNIPVAIGIGGLRVMERYLV